MTRRKQRAEEHDQYTKQQYKCDKCGMVITLHNQLKKHNPSSIVCNDGECEGIMYKEGKPEQIAKSHKLKPGDVYIRPMSLDENTEMVYFKMRANQKLVPEDQRSDDEDLWDAAGQMAQKFIDEGNNGISIDVIKGGKDVH